MSESPTSIEGVYVASVTPFRDDVELTVDVDAYLGHVEWLAARGVRGVVAFGTNGEGPSVTTDEKLAVLGALYDARLPVQIIPTVAEATLADSLRMLAALEELPAPAAMVLPPYFFKPVSVEGLRRFYEPVVRACSRPVILYHIPRYSVPIPEELVVELPVWGVKDSGEDHDYAPRLLERGRGVLIGTEDDLWARLASGAQGVVSGLANFAPEDVVGVYEAVRAGDAARGEALSARLQRVRSVAASPAARKRLASLRSGRDLGTVRPPLVPVADDTDLVPVVDELEAGRV
jgi:4-hydroxy-tetrahydrodipicolinate synthase